MKIKFNKIAFQTYYDGLSKEEKQRVRDEFLQVTGLSYPSWFTKRSRGAFSPLELAELKRITGKDFSIQL